MHIASIETATTSHVSSIAMGGKELHDVLVIAQSSDMELHSLDSFES